jgi:hypothetical protein
MSAPDKDGGGGTAKPATVNKGVKPSKVSDVKNKKSWLSPIGEFFPVKPNETHNDWAKNNTSASHQNGLYASGWARVVSEPGLLGITTSLGEPNPRQVASLKDFALITKDDLSVPYTEIVWDQDAPPYGGKTLWETKDNQAGYRAFCPNGRGNGVTNTCRVGINVNDEAQDFTGQILSGAKTTETRITNSLKPYVGETVGIVRTGKGKATLVGTMKIGEPKFYGTPEEFDADFDKHQIAKDSPHYIGTEGKYGYPLSEVKPLKPVELPPGGRIARVLHKSKREMTVVFDLGGESPEHPNESRGDAPAPKKDKIKGSDVNDEGSAKNKSGDISLNESIVASLKSKAEEHNAAMRKAKKPSWTHVSLPALKAVYRRGAGAFSTSHRPGMTRDRWALARVNAFLTLARRGRPENAKYTTDNDLLHSDHPKHSKESRGFCATGEGGGVDNSCGAKTMSAPDKDGGGGSSAASSVVFSSSTTAKLLDGDTIDASDEDADENVAAINWQAAEEVGRSNPELQQAVYKYSAGPHEVNGYFRYGESLDEYAENIGSTPEKLAASASATESAITTIAAAANPDGRELTSFRGLMNRRQNREYIEAIKSVSVGDVIKEAGVFSTSASLRRASMAFTSQDGGVIFRVKGKGGAPIAHVANYRDEWEVAYPNRSRFVVTSVARNVSVRISDSHRLTNVTFIDIREAD